MYDTNRIVRAAEPCAYHEAFAEDMRRCDNALGMGGLMGINAECWLDVLNGMTDARIAEYVNTKYKHGILNPFRDTSLFIKHSSYQPFHLSGGAAFLFVKIRN